MLIVWPPGHYRAAKPSLHLEKEFLENNNKNAPKLIHADNNCKISLSAGPVQEAARTKGVQGSDAGVLQPCACRRCEGTECSEV